jgi:hypothetical protein
MWSTRLTPWDARIASNRDAILASVSRMQIQLRNAWFPILGALGVAALAGCVPADPEAGAAGQTAGDDTGVEGVDVAGLTAAAPVVPFGMVGIVGTGQSLSVGAMATAFSGAAGQPHFNNLKLALNGTVVPPFNPNAGALSLVALTEPLRPLATTFPSAYPANLYGETPHAAMAAQVTNLARQAGAADYLTVHTVVGESGQGMSVINKTATEVNSGGTSTGRAYRATLFEVTAIKRLAAARGKTYGIGAIVLTHGETDSGNTGYESAMVKLWSDYNQDLRAITGQSQSIPMLTSQQHSFGFTANQVTSIAPATIAEWRVGVDNPNNILCAGPKYQYPYASDNIHLVTRGYELLGEKYAEVYFQRVVLGAAWQPLQPISVSRSGRVVTVRFHVPVLPLAWDTALPMPHQSGARTQWAQGRGFELRQGTTPLTISSVQIVNDTVQITAAANVPAGVTVGYAATSDGIALAGVSRRWGKLIDSDRTVGMFTGQAQANFALAFEMAVP